MLKESLIEFNLPEISEEKVELFKELVVHMNELTAILEAKHM